MNVSVVIPTLNHKEQLRDCLASLLRQTRPAQEILVVDNGSTDGTDALLEREFRGRARRVREPARGVHRARNRGIREAQGDVLLFTDDDVLAPPRWIETLASCFEDPSVAAAGGPTRPLWTEAPPPFLLGSRRTLSCLGVVDWGDERKRLDGGAEFLIGANLACRKSVVSGDDGFKAVHPFPGLGTCADDYELSRRLARRHVVLYEPAAYVRHRISRRKLNRRYLLGRLFHFEAAGAVLGSRLRPKRRLRELLGWEGAVSAAVTLGHWYGRARCR